MKLTNLQTGERFCIPQVTVLGAQRGKCKNEKASVLLGTAVLDN
jgi:hypothetical protein